MLLSPPCPFGVLSALPTSTITSLKVSTWRWPHLYIIRDEHTRGARAQTEMAGFAFSGANDDHLSARSPSLFENYCDT